MNLLGVEACQRDPGKIESALGPPAGNQTRHCLHAAEVSQFDKMKTEVASHEGQVRSIGQRAAVRRRLDKQTSGRQQVAVSALEMERAGYSKNQELGKRTSRSAHKNFERPQLQPSGCLFVV